MEIFADPVTINCRKVLAGMKFLEVDYTLAPVSFMAGEHKAPDYLEVNPNGSLPAMRDGEFVLWESNAILQYVADKQSKTDQYPTDLKARADVNRWLLWESSAWMPTCYLYVVENCLKPLLGDSTDQQALANEAENFALRASVLDARLSSSKWLCGNAPTIADIAVAAPMHLHGPAGLPLDAHPNLRRWMTEEVEQLPAWKATHIDENFALSPQT